MVLGALVDRGLLRFLRGREPTALLLVTYALFLILEDVIKLIWGVDPYIVSEPYALLGSFSIGPLSYPNYTLIIVLAAVLSGLALTWFLQFTRKGKMLRAVIHDAEMSQSVGIDVDRWFFITFVTGTVLACLAGALVAPTISVVPGMGVEVIVLMFAVVVIGGLGSIPGAAVGALLVGFVRSAAVHYWPEAELFSIYGVMALILVVRPKGLFAAPEPERYDRAPLSRTHRRVRSRSARWRLAPAVMVLRYQRRDRQSDCGPRPRASHARRPGIVRAGPVLLHRRLHRGRARNKLQDL